MLDESNLSSIGIKSVNIWLTQSFSTNHHINVPIINKYRKVCWVFAIYEGIEMRRAYFMAPGLLEDYFQRWEDKWVVEQKDINNPKIPLKFVMDNGKLVYSDNKALDLVKASRLRAKRTKEAKERKASKNKAVKELKLELGRKRP